MGVNFEDQGSLVPTGRQRAGTFNFPIPGTSRGKQGKAGEGRGKQGKAGESRGRQGKAGESRGRQGKSHFSNTTQDCQPRPSVMNDKIHL